MFDIDQIKKNVVKWGKVEEQNKTHKGTIVQTSGKPLSAKTNINNNYPATIGASIHFKGELSGAEDFIIQGKVDGEINLQKNNLTIGIDGIINANITAKIIIVEGTLQGDMFGSEKVIIRNTGNVLGNIIAPRVTLEDGAKFKGSIEMEPDSKSTQGKSEIKQINH